MRPTKVNILGKVYSITYVEKPSDVDIHHEESLWGQVDFWTRTIRIFDRDRSDEDLWHTLLHEIIHAIAEELHLPNLANWKDDKTHDELDLLALALTDILFRNDWLKKEQKANNEDE